MHDRLLRFLLLCEGSSDTALVPHLRQLLSDCGAAEVVGAAFSLAHVPVPRGGDGSVLERKIRAVLSVDSEFDVLFVHRDADTAGHEERLNEIVTASCNAGLNVASVAVVPVRMTEAWILLDEEAIRRVAGNPRGRQPLDLPRPARIEDDPNPKKTLEDALVAARRWGWNPKKTLEDALVAAGGHQGHRRKKFRKKFAAHRRILLEQLPVGGALNEVPAWVRLKHEVVEFVSEPHVPQVR